eukprot:TRINITY_DN1749_c1_g2_i2.p2 TRINITY_DN1749_c1_g2~~TRINITY_DN1749_c1_g2_i2.p2  ORF type:complete len:167 (+),score=29.72 TRINITY_DN1749_c1_g2_i2:31-531(+)
MEEAILESLATERDLVLENVWIGNQQAAGWLPSWEQTETNILEKAKNLKKDGITNILCCCDGTQIFNDPSITYHQFDIRDSPSFRISQHFDTTYDVISRCTQAGLGILIHCNAGASRSATIATAYLMKYKGWSYEQANDYIIKVRACVNTSNFKEQLIEYESSLGL